MINETGEEFYDRRCGRHYYPSFPPPSPMTPHSPPHFSSLLATPEDREELPHIPSSLGSRVECMMVRGRNIRYKALLATFAGVLWWCVVRPISPSGLYMLSRDIYVDWNNDTDPARSNVSSTNLFINSQTENFSEGSGHMEEHDALSITSLSLKESDVEERISKRRTLLEQACGRHSLRCSPNATLNHRVYYFHHYNTSVCTIAKAGSSTWRAHLRRANGGPPVTKPIHEDPVRKELLAHPLKDVEKIFNSTARIVTVRHPLVRLVSTYRQKYSDGLLLPQYLAGKEHRLLRRLAHSTWGSRVHQFWVPALASNGLLPPDLHRRLGLPNTFDPDHKYSTSVYVKLREELRPRLTFKQFLRHVVATFRRGEPDAHWASYVHQCCFCRYEYHYVTKVETLTEDLEHVFHRLGIPSNPSIVKNQVRSSLDDMFSEFWYYKNIPNKLKKEIYNIYKLDFEFFDYKLPKSFSDIL